MSLDVVLGRLGGLSTTLIGDAMGRLGIASGLAPIWTGARAVGVARTVWTAQGDNKMVHEAIEVCNEGDFLVVNGGGDTTRALVGELMAIRAMNRGVVGFVIDGAVRDRDELAELGFPVWARAVSPAGPYKNGPGFIDCPVAIGHVVVCPGDVVAGDSNGVVVVPAERAETICKAAEELAATEDSKRRSYGKVAT